MIPLIIAIAAAAMILIEIMQPGRAWGKVRGWWVRVVLLNGCQIGIAYLAIYTWDTWMDGARPWNADQLGVTWGAIVGYVAITFVYYWWHRARHEVPLLWRWIHQVHHSPSRIEVFTSFYKHPLEILLNGLLSSAILYFLVGLGPQAATYAVMISGLAELFYHWNVRTPRWLGYLVQRPESHCYHHERGVHGRNYADLPVWDMLFGTFHNPPVFDGQCGFGPDKETKLWPMLSGKELEWTKRQSSES